MKEKLSKKERKQLRLVGEERIIRGISTLTHRNEISWEKSRDDWAHSDYYRALVSLNNAEVRIECADDRGYRLLGIYHHEAHEVVQRTRKNKRQFNILLSLIREQIRKKEEEEAQKQQSQDDTTQVLPFSPEEKKETKLLAIRKHHEELKGAIEALKQI